MTDFYDLLHVVNYLYHHQSDSLIIRAGEPNQALTLTCYVDAAYLSHADSKSHTGYCLSFGTVGSFYSKSSKQSLVTTSSTHAELRAIFQLTKDILFVISLCDSLHRPISLPAIVFEDNSASITLTQDFHGRTKNCRHFLMLVDYIREQVASGILHLKKIPTRDNPADILTKYVSDGSFASKSHQLLGSY